MLVQMKTLSEMAAAKAGYVDKMYADALRQVLDDCRSRPADTAKRKLIVTFEFEPVADSSDGRAPQLESVNYDVSITTRVPHARSMPFNAAVLAGKNGAPIGLEINDASVDNVRQRTLDQAAAESR